MCLSGHSSSPESTLPYAVVCQILFGPFKILHVSRMIWQISQRIFLHQLKWGKNQSGLGFRVLPRSLTPLAVGRAKACYPISDSLLFNTCSVAVIFLLQPELSWNSMTLSRRPSNKLKCFGSAFSVWRQHTWNDKQTQDINYCPPKLNIVL